MVKEIGPRLGVGCAKFWMPICTGDASDAPMVQIDNQA